MAPIYWITGLVVVALLFRFINKANRRHVRALRSTELTKENDQLRYVVAALTVDKHFPPEDDSKWWP
jgi:hypothetical protein